MLDVHPPHHPTHTWKDFWIHLGTITVGLLIAISLEQTVEAFHRLHMRHELEHELREECEGNQRKAAGNFESYDSRIAWLLGLRRDVDTMIATHGNANLPYRPLSGPIDLLLDTSAWDTARDDERLTLLPDYEASNYSIDYKMAQLLLDARQEYMQVLSRQRAFESRFADLADPTTPLLSRMNAQQLEEYARLISDTLIAVINQKTRLTYYYGMNAATMKGVKDVEGRLVEQRAALDAHPTNYRKLAEQSDPTQSDAKPKTAQ